jgi:rod shape-determining protein MreD
MAPLQRKPADRTPGIRPRETLGRRLDRIGRASFPAAASIGLMLLTVAPFGFAGQAALLPAVAVGSVYFWSLYRPGAMPPVLVFGIGLLLDLLGYLPLGVGVLMLLTVHGLVLRLRRLLVRQSFLVVWVIYAGFALGATTLGWGLASLLGFRLLPVSAAMFQFVVAVALYPALGVVLTSAHRSIADPEQA